MKGGESRHGGGRKAPTRENQEEMEGREGREREQTKVTANEGKKKEELRKQVGGNSEG